MTGVVAAGGAFEKILRRRRKHEAEITQKNKRHRKLLGKGYQVLQAHWERGLFERKREGNGKESERAWEDSCERGEGIWMWATLNIVRKENELPKKESS